MTKLKILYLLTKDDLGGAQKYVADLASHLDPHRFLQKILYGGRDAKWLSNRVLPWTLFANDWLALFELVRVFRRERPDIIHLNSSKAGVLGSFAAAIYKMLFRFQLPITNNQLPKIIFTAHGWVFNPTNYVAAPIRWCYIMIHWLAAHFQNTIINVSEYDRCLALHYKIAPAHKLVTIHNGIDPNIPFLSKEAAREEILKKLPTASHQPLATRVWIGSIGRITKEKDYETLIRAAALVSDAYFFIIGEGTEAKNLQRITDNLTLNNRIFFIEPTGEDWKFMKAFDVFALSSIKEGFPYVLLEALAAGIPAVATEAGGMPEIALRVKSVRVAPPKDARSFSKELERALARRDPPAPAVPFPLLTTVRETEGVYLTPPKLP